jgi:hypothetical protein
MSNSNANQRAKVSPKKMMLPKPDFRFLTVHTRYKPAAKGFEEVPEIVLKGDWLKEFGFQCGELVKICTAGPYLEIIRTVTEKEQKRWKL